MYYFCNNCKRYYLDMFYKQHTKIKCYAVIFHNKNDID